MTLATHGIVGAAAAAVVTRNPIIAFVIGFVSHFLLDAIPHWDYQMLSAKKKVEFGNFEVVEDLQYGRAFLLDLLRFGSDAFLGILIPVLTMAPTLWESGFMGGWVATIPLIAGAIGGILPDPLQFAYWKLRREPLATLQRFHMWIHAKTSLKDKPVVGILSQIIIIMTAIIAIRIL